MPRVDGQQAAQEGFVEPTGFVLLEAVAVMRRGLDDITQLAVNEIDVRGCLA
jgi:hypothetical protein